MKIKIISKLSIAFGLLSLLLGNTASASNTGGVFPPAVNEGHRSIQYRNGYDPENHNYAQRLHYQQAINDDFMWRGMVQTRKTADSDHDVDFVQAELFWQLENISANWQHGFRFDARLRSDSRPDQFGVNWMNQFALAPSWNARFVILSSFETGSGSRSGVFLQSRANLMHRVNDRWSVNLELFNTYGSTSDLGFGNRSQQFGPSVVLNAGDGWQVFAGFLAGLNDSSPDESYRFWLTKSF